MCVYVCVCVRAHALKRKLVALIHSKEQNGKVFNNDITIHLRFAIPVACVGQNSPYRIWGRERGISGHNAWQTEWFTLSLHDVDAARKRNKLTHKHRVKIASQWQCQIIQAQNPVDIRRVSGVSWKERERERERELNYISLFYSCNNYAHCQSLEFNFILLLISNIMI